MSLGPGLSLIAVFATGKTWATGLGGAPRRSSACNAPSNNVPAKMFICPTSKTFTRYSSDETQPFGLHLSSSRCLEPIE